MEQGLFGEVNLFADQDKENEKYINAIDAIELIKFKTGNHVPDVCRFLILKGFGYSTQTYRKDYLGQIFTNDSRIEDIPFEDWSITNDILKKGLENFKYSGNRYSDNYEKADYEHYYWLKSDFFNFEAIQKLNITPDDYSNFLISKVMLWGSKRKKDTFIEEMEKLDECELQAKNKIIPLLYKKPLLTLHEAACIMTGYNPQYVEQCQNDTNFKGDFSNYLEAYDYISTCIDAQMLSYDSYSNRLYASEFKQFLANVGHFVDGFNDGLDEPKSNIMDSDLNTQKIISNLELDLAIEKNKVEKLNEEIDHLKSEIAKWEASQAVQQDCLLSQIFDESATERYAPDLALSIKLWEHIYITNPKSDSHTNKAIKWLKSNTGYEVSKKAGSASKIREITTPFVSWGNLRDKNYKK